MNGEFMVEESTRKGLCHIPIIAMTADMIYATHYKLKTKNYFDIFLRKNILKNNIYYNPKYLLKCEMERCVSKLFEKENLYHLRLI